MGRRALELIGDGFKGSRFCQLYQLSVALHRPPCQFTGHSKPSSPSPSVPFQVRASGNGGSTVRAHDLIKASSALRSNVLERAARSHARPEDVAKAKAFHAAALKCNRHLDTRFYDALLPAAEGDVDKTLRALRKLASPEARSAIFHQLFRTQGAQPTKCPARPKLSGACPDRVPSRTWALTVNR
jgi:hypothetical protein